MTTGKKRILLVKPIVPYPPDQGTKIVSFGLIRALAREYEVTVLARILNREDRVRADELEQSCARVVTVLPSNRKSIVHRAAYKLWYTLVSRVRRRSLKSLYDCPGAFVKAARRLATEDFDLVIVEYWQLYPMLEVFPREKTVLLTHDIDLLVNRQSSLLERNLLRKIGKVRKWLLEQKEEVYAYQHVDRVFALTARDAIAVSKIAKNDVPVDVLPVGFEVDPLPESAGARDSQEVLFMGVLSAGFNLDSLEYFCTKIYPHLDEVPGLKITVVGGELPKRLAYFANYDNVNVVGHVSDVRPYLSRAGCLVIPLRYGGGLRVRIVEAMMAGLPVICSSVAITGMDFEPEAEFILADEPKDVAAGIKRLVEDPEFASDMAARAKKAVIDRHAVDVQADRAIELIRDIIDN